MARIKAIQYKRNGELYIRPDVKKIIDLSDDQFEEWYVSRKEALSKFEENYRLVGSIPLLSCNYEANLGNQYGFRYDKLLNSLLSSGLDYINTIKDWRERLKDRDTENIGGELSLTDLVDEGNLSLCDEGGLAVCDKD